MLPFTRPRLASSVFLTAWWSCWRGKLFTLEKVVRHKAIRQLCFHCALQSQNKANSVWPSAGMDAVTYFEETSPQLPSFSANTQQRGHAAEWGAYDLLRNSLPSISPALPPLHTSLIPREKQKPWELHKHFLTAPGLCRWIVDVTTQVNLPDM